MELNNLLNYDRGSSLVNFCETDIIENRIVEYFNTISSLAIVIFGFYGIMKVITDKEIQGIFKKNSDISIQKDFMTKSKSSRYILNIVLVLVGFGSMYFHSELSVFAHWVDIILISIILLLSEYYLDYIEKKPSLLIYYFFGILHLISSLFIPSLHIFIQYITGFLIVKKINSYMKKLKEKGESNYDIMTIHKQIEKKYFHTKIIFLLTIILWVIDYFGCTFIHPYHTHWIFHFGIGLTAYRIIDMSKYMWLIKSHDVIENRV